MTAGKQKPKEEAEIEQVEAANPEPETESQPVCVSESESEDLAAIMEERERIRRELQDINDNYLRALADFDNFRKRQREETARQVNAAREAIIAEILPVVDNFERALAAAEANHSYESLVEGVKLTLRQLTDVLTRLGLEPIEAVGQEFNPELHEAVATVVTDEYPEHTVCEEVEKGYKLNGKLIRPARVRVASPE